MYFTHDFTLFDVSLFNFSNTLSTHQIFFFTSPPLLSSILTVYLLIIQFFVSLFFFFYRAYSNFLLHLLLCLFLLNEWSLHVTNFVVLWFSSHSLSLSLKIHENEEKVQDIQQCLIPVCNTIFGRNGKISPRTGQNLGWHRTWGSPAPVCPPERKIPAIPARTKWNSKLCHNLPVLLYFYFYFFIIFSPWISNPPCFFLLFYFFPFGNLPSTNYHFAMSSYS